LGFSATFAFCINAPRLATFFIAPKICIFEAHLLSPFEVLHYCILLHVLQCVAVEAHLLSPSKIWQLWALKSYKLFMEPPYTTVTPYQAGIGSLDTEKSSADIEPGSLIIIRVEKVL